MASIRNIFACLVHENQECVVDLVRNLHYLDPDSVILLYNGGHAADLLSTGFPFESYGAIVHPSPRPMELGRLHDFALDCMQFALSELPFDTLTIVDSDQLATRAGYSEYLSRHVQGHKQLGLLASNAKVLHSTTSHGPAQTAFSELELWRPYLRRFPHGEEKFVHWSFWPSTVFTQEAARNLVRLFSTDHELRTIMLRSGIWATEELILPTLVALLDYEITINPCNSNYVQYKANYTPSQVEAALNREDVFWIHPVPRRFNDPIRKRIRERFGNYQERISSETKTPKLDGKSRGATGVVLSIPILNRMRKIEGWLDEEEADLLLATCNQAILSATDKTAAVVEIGSFCGRSTVVLGSVVQSLDAPTKVYAIDCHEGVVGAAGTWTTTLGSTLGVFRKNMLENRLTSVVEAIVKRSYEVSWDKLISFLFIDGLHDYGNVSRDFHHFEQWLVSGGYIAFHDYADYYPGVKKFVDELLAQSRYELVCNIKSLIVVRKIQGSLDTPAMCDLSIKTSEKIETPAVMMNAQTMSAFVSCIMPTANRRALIPQAIRYFLRQDYPNRELIILDDGSESVADLIPENEHIRYLYLSQKLSMGAKHNMACEMAHGEIIVHWDDDDWVSPRRVSYQVHELQEQANKTAMDTLCGLSHVMFYDPRQQRAWEYRYPGGKPWVLGSTFCYYKNFWERHRFPHMNEGADTAFVWNLQNVHVRAHPDHTFHVGTVHAHNTSPKRTETVGWHPLSSQEIRRLMNEEDWSFYKHFMR